MEAGYVAVELWVVDGERGAVVGCAGVEAFVGLHVFGGVGAPERGFFVSVLGVAAA